MSLCAVKPPCSEGELLSRGQVIQGLSLSQLAASLGLYIPEEAAKRKGWIGRALEMALGANAGIEAKPDFINLGIELKTIPIGASGRPVESTFVTTVSLLPITNQTWETSPCCVKLRRVLWFPVESDAKIAFHDRRLGKPVLWSPTKQQNTILKADWTMLTTMISLGQLHEIDASMGEFLQIRPKGANALSLSASFDDMGMKTATLPRGFYLRSLFTASIMQNEINSRS